ncbi:MAG TPA: FAD-dependent oxidoreductase [Lapillicoccus sp.]|nr:FAD-dependent oxidoreductase [Lapillicoccus sp.]
MSRPGRVLVVGAGVAGFTVVDELRHAGYDGAITLVGNETHLPYDRPPLSKQVLSGTWTHDRATLTTAQALSELQLDLRLGVAARALDVARRTVTLEDGSVLTADAVVLATGSHAIVPPWAHLGPRVLALRTLDDALRLGTLLRGSTRLAVVGTGFLGLEVAAAARSLGLAEVVVAGPLEPMVTAVGETVSGRLRALHEAQGVVLDVGHEVVEVDGDRTGVTVRFADRAARADAVVVALGARPNVAWLSGSGLTVVPGVVVDDRGRAAPGVHAVGEVCAWPDRLGRPRRVDHRQSAGEQARTVAADLLGETDPLALVPYWWSDQFDVRIQAYGVTGRDREERWLAGDPDAPTFALAQRDGDLVGGVVGWNAARATREARALVAEPTPWPHRAA